MQPSYIKVIKPGVYSLLQDAGRFGFARLGITPGGPMDDQAFKWANRLCGNPLDAAALEITFGGLVLQAQGSITVAVTGAAIPCQVNGQPVEMWQTIALKTGDVLQLGFARRGVRGYLAVSGGFAVRKQFGSVATVARENLGGLSGGPLQGGDKLPVGTSSKRKPGKYWLEKTYRPQFANKLELRVIPSRQEQVFSRQQKKLFYSSEYRVTTESDRMGYRLEGEPVKVKHTSRLSAGICLGAIQIPPNGQPIVLMQDRQTIGGYPILGTVTSIDLALLAQLVPESLICFKPITANQALSLLRKQYQQFANTPVSFRPS